MDLETPHRGPALSLNASRAAVTALQLGVPLQAICEGIRSYQGISRRMELRHAVGGVMMLDDYAHNPAPIRTLAAALREYYPDRRLIGVFEPRQHRRIVAFADEYGHALGAFDVCLILPVSRTPAAAREFPARPRTRRTICRLPHRPSTGSLRRFPTT
jgi:UDP-N-acetylmuramate--alanine ligase